MILRLKKNDDQITKGKIIIKFHFIIFSFIYAVGFNQTFASDFKYEGKGLNKLAYTVNERQIKNTIVRMQIELLGQGKHAQEISIIIGKHMVNEGFMCFQATKDDHNSNRSLVCSNAFCIQKSRTKKQRINFLELSYKSQQKKLFDPKINTAKHLVKTFKKCPKNQAEKRTLNIKALQISKEDLKKYYVEILH